MTVDDDSLTLTLHPGRAFYVGFTWFGIARRRAGAAPRRAPNSSKSASRGALASTRVEEASRGSVLGARPRTRRAFNRRSCSCSCPGSSRA